MLQDICLVKAIPSKNVTKVSKIVESLMSLNEPKENLEQERPLKPAFSLILTRKKPSTSQRN